MLQTRLSLLSSRLAHYSMSVKGFTLIELVMVIVIIGAIGTVALPRFFSVETYNQRNAFDELYTAIKVAQRTAIASGCQTSITVSTNGFAILKNAACSSTDLADFNNAGFNNEVWNPGEQAFGYSYTTPSGISYSSTETVIIFNGAGQPLTNSFNPASDITVTVTGDTTANMTIESDTGYTHRS